MELCIDESNERIERLYSPNAPRELAEAVSATGVPLLSMCLSAHRRYPFGSADPEVRKKAGDIIERAIELAVRLGIRTIQLAAYDVYYEPSTAYSKALYAEGLALAASLAARSGVMLANEIMDTAFINSISRHLEYERQINNPWLRVYPDLGNLSAWGNDVEAELLKGAGSIVQVHLKDTLAVTSNYAGQFRDVAFGEGCVDFRACFTALERQGYCGPYLIEMWHHAGDDDEARVTAARKYIESRFDESL